jgi:hyperosmotically inducible protein
MVNSIQGAAYAMKETSQEATLTAKIQTAYSLSRRIPPGAKINVDSEDGVVTLKGEVPTEDAKNSAETIAWDITGVREVHNQLYVTGVSR